MGQPIYRIADKVHSELAALRADLLRRVKFNVTTAAKAKETYDAEVARLMRDAHVLSHDDEMIRCRCAGPCGEIHTVKRSSVFTYRCSCSPHLEQYAYQTRVMDA